MANLANLAKGPGQMLAKVLIGAVAVAYGLSNSFYTGMASLRLSSLELLF